MSTSTTGRTPSTRTKLDTIVASLVARQSRTDDGSKSVPDQVDAMRAWCAAQNPPVVVGHVYTEYDVSGRKPLAKRKGLLAAVEDVEHGASQMILTAYFDRFVRNTMTRAEVLIRVEEQCGGSVMTLDFGKTSNATPVSKLTGTMLAAVAEYVADSAAEKTMISKQRNIDNGVPPFPRLTPAYVRRSDGTLEPHPVFGPLVREACERRVRGESFATIANFLREHDMRDINGNLITRQSVVSMLSSPLLVGEIHFGNFTANLRAAEKWHAIELDSGELFGPAIVDRATWRAMQKTRSTRGRHAKSDRLLARQGILLCGTCGARLIAGSTRANTQSKRYTYYVCGNPHCSHRVTISAEPVEQYVRDAAIKIAAEHAADVEGRASLKTEVEEARVAAEDAKQRYANAIRTLLGRDDDPVAKEVLDELQVERDDAIAHHERLRRLTAPSRTVTPANWDDLSLDGKRGVVKATIRSVAVHASSSRSRSVPVETRVTLTPRTIGSE